LLQQYDDTTHLAPTNVFSIVDDTDLSAAEEKFKKNSLIFDRLTKELQEVNWYMKNRSGN